MYSRKKRVHPVLLLILAVVFLLMAGAAATRTAEAASSQGYTTDWYRVHVQVMKNYEFRFTEKIRVNFSERRHGIYRDIPTGANYRIRDIRVDGDAYSVKRQDGSMVVRIGSADRYVTGKKTYTIHYTLAHITRKGAANDIYTDLLPTGWSTGIGSAGITMDLPADLTLKKVRVYTGGYGSGDSLTGGWKYEKERHRVSVHLENVPAKCGVTIRAGVPEGYWKGAPSIDWTNYLSTAILSGAVLLLLLLRLRLGRRPQYAETVEFYAPEDMNPLEVGYLVDGNVDRKDITSMFFYLASKGYIRIRETGEKNFEFEKTADISEEESGAAKRFYRGIFGTKGQKKENGFTVSMKAAGDRLGKAYEAVKDMTEDSFTGERSVYSKQSKTAGMIGTILCVAAVFLLILLALFRDGAFQAGLMQGLGICVLGTFLLTALMLGFRKVSEYRYSRKRSSTAIRYALWSVCYVVLCVIYIYLIGGIRTGQLDLAVIAGLCIFLILSPLLLFSMQIRSDWSARTQAKLKGFRNFIRDAELAKLNELVEEDPDYFYNILPYAYVLGLTDRWAKQFEQIPLEKPDWYIPYGTEAYGNVFYASMFSSRIRNFSAAAVHDVQLSSDSGGWSSLGGGFTGGGGFSGGGSGGGGGGAW